MYNRKQTGWVVILSLLAGLILIIIIAFLEPNWILYIVIVLLLICLFLFYSLTVKVDHELIHVLFGTGIISKKFKLSDVLSCKPVRNKWYFGWGIRLIPGGWMFNVSGLQAVQLILKNNKKFRIGTDDPEGLCQAIILGDGGRRFDKFDKLN